MVEALRLVRRFHATVAVDGATFTVPQGSITGLLGPNGAGKTSTIRMLVGALAPTSGFISIAGVDMAERPREARRRVGYLPEHNALHPELRVEEHLEYRGRLHGLHGRALSQNVDRELSRCHLTEVRRRLVGTLSKGYRQRVGLAAALVASPAVVVLDEPTSGLDPTQIAEFRALLRSLAPAQTVLLSSHVLGEIEAVCERLIMMRGGRVAAVGTLEEIRRLTGSGRRVVVEALADEATLRRILAGASAVPPGAARAATPSTTGLFIPSASTPFRDWPRDRPCVRLELDCVEQDDALLRTRIAEACLGAGIVVRELSTRTPSLEELFQTLASDGAISPSGGASTRRSNATAPAEHDLP